MVEDDEKKGYLLSDDPLLERWGSPVAVVDERGSTETVSPTLPITTQNKWEAHCIPRLRFIVRG